MTVTEIKLKVTLRTDCAGEPVWTGYAVCDDCATVIVETTNLDDLRYWAGRNGYDGIVLRTPSVPFVSPVGPRPMLPIFVDNPDRADLTAPYTESEWSLDYDDDRDWVAFTHKSV